MDDPMEIAMASALRDAGIRFVLDDAGSGLDFYLPDFDVYIEVKQFHSDRIAEQMARRKNVIAVQGIPSVAVFRRLFASA